MLRPLYPPAATRVQSAHFIFHFLNSFRSTSTLFGRRACLHLVAISGLSSWSKECPNSPALVRALASQCANPPFLHPALKLNSLLIFCCKILVSSVEIKLLCCSIPCTHTLKRLKFQGFTLQSNAVVSSSHKLSIQNCTYLYQCNKLRVLISSAHTVVKWRQSRAECSALPFTCRPTTTSADSHWGGWVGG